MKKILTIVVAAMLSVAAMAQSDVTKFLGIPVDGTKSAMIQKLKAKGFTYNATLDLLTGQFNGRSVKISVVTNNNKVYRIAVIDATASSESDIKIRFNTLCRQFMKNEKYMPANFVGNYEIEEDVNISYEMSVNSKRFEAAFYQVNPTDTDTAEMIPFFAEKIQEEYPDGTIDNLSETERNEFTIRTTLEYLNMKVSHRSVWFMIDETYGKYRILMYYDNEKNKANGEDL